jgi:hypothetical protein
MNFRAIVLVASLVFCLMACTGTGNAAGGTSSGKPIPPLRSVVLVSGSLSISVEVAKNDEERSRGLMFRTKLAEGKGMFFVFDADERPSFWMKNTSIPLSLAFIASDGSITQILDLVPFSTEARPSERFVRYALEVPRGWFAKVGLKPGDRFTIPPLN